jgi:hypothetical protein
MGLWKGLQGVTTAVEEAYPDCQVRCYGGEQGDVTNPEAAPSLQSYDVPRPVFELLLTHCVFRRCNSSHKW